MQYVGFALMMLLGAFLVTPGGAQTAVKWRRMNHRRQQCESEWLSEVRNNRIAGAAIIAFTTVIVLMSIL